MDQRPPLRLKPDTSGGFHPVLGLRPRHIAQSQEIARRDGALAELDLHGDWGARLRREAYLLNSHSSTSIEGNPLSVADVRKVAHQVDAGAQATGSRHETEIVHHYAWFRALGARASGPFDAPGIAEVQSTHRALLRDVLHDQRLIGALRGKRHDQNVTFGRNEGTPPGRVAVELDALFNWYNGAGLFRPAPIRIAVWLHEFLSIHPFVDGNGRAARAFTHRLLVSEGLPGSLMIALDAPFNHDRDRYTTALDAARTTGQLTPWIDYFLDCLLWAYDDATRRLNRIASAPRGLAGAQAAIIEHVVRTGAERLVVSELTAVLPYEPGTITTALLALTNEHGLLQHNGKRGRASAYHPTATLLAGPAANH